VENCILGKVCAVFCRQVPVEYAVDVYLFGVGIVEIILPTSLSTFFSTPLSVSCSRIIHRFVQACTNVRICSSSWSRELLRFTSSFIFSHEWITVVWSRPPSFSPIDG